MTTPNTDPDALEQLVSGIGFEDQVDHYDALRDALAAIASEKRRAREGVTWETLDRAAKAIYESRPPFRDRDGYPVSYALLPTSYIQHYHKTARAALEAVWPDAKDAKDAEREKGEPVAWMHPDMHKGHPYPEECLNQEEIEGWLPLYTHAAAQVPDGYVLVPAKLNSVQADIVGMPAAWYERAVARLAAQEGRG